MPGPRTADEARLDIEAVERALREGYRPRGVSGTGPGAVAIAAGYRGVTGVTMDRRIARLCEKGKGPDWNLWKKPGAPEPVVVERFPALEEPLLARLKKGGASLADLAQEFSTSKGKALDAIEALQGRGVNIHLIGDRYSIEAARPPAYTLGQMREIVSNPDNTFTFGVVADSHYCSKYAREDVTNDLYDRFERAGITHVYHCGNWIDGEASFNRHDLLVHGMDAQCRYLAERYPRRDGITTFAVAGDDHEGWYAQREGVDIGRYAEQRFRDAGRTDWVDLGYMEAHIRMVNANTGKSAVMAVVHPGGGSSYADSYVVQKIIESLDGGEKPGFAAYGHYHKQIAGEYRNVWWLQPGCGQDQTPFARKKRLRFVLGGAKVSFEQDPETGALVGYTPTMWRYFNQGYYENRWSHSGPVTHTDLRAA